MFSVCVLLYGDHLPLARRVLQSIDRSDHGSYGHIADLRIGLNEVGADTRRFVAEFCHRSMPGIPVHVYEPERNVGKYPIMRRMFYDKNRPLADHVMWFDDDSYLERAVDRQWWEEVRILADRGLVGSVWHAPLRGNQHLGLNAQPWCGELPLEEKQVLNFITGGWWAARSETICRDNYPFPELYHNGGDLVLGALAYQRGIPLVKFVKNVVVNEGHYSSRRGIGVPIGTEKFAWQDYAVGTDSDQSHQEFSCKITTHAADREPGPPLPNVILRMHERKFCFLGGLPRAGSTLLCNILAQNPRIYATHTSGCMDVMFMVRNNWNQMIEHQAHPNDEAQRRVLRGILHNYYDDVERPVVIDKCRGWVSLIEMAEFALNQQIKIIVPVRDIRDVLASFEKLHRATQPHSRTPGEVDNYFQFQSADGRCAFWMRNDQTVGLAVNRIGDALTRGFRDRMHFVPFAALTARPAETLAAVYNFLGEPPFPHDFNCVEQVTWEDDSVHGFRGLHDIRPKVEAVSPQWQTVLGEFVSKYAGCNRIWESC